MKKRLIPTLLLLSTTLCAQLIERKGVVRSETWLSLGNTYLYDEHLTRLGHRGFGLSINHERLFTPSYLDKRWLMSHLFKLDGAYTLNTPRSGVLAFLLPSYRFGMYHHTLRWNNLSLYTGGELNVYVGGVHNLTGGNNQGNAHAGIDLDLSLQLQYPFRIGNHSFEARYKGSVPLVGTFFSPRYLESYYSIFMLSNFWNNFQFAHPGNLQGINQRLSLGWNLSSWQLQIGWEHSFRRTHAWDLTTQRNSHYFTIGVSRQLIFLKKR